MQGRSDNISANVQLYGAMQLQADSHMLILPGEHVGERKRGGNCEDRNFRGIV